uniref:Uncharacterized protein n=1 Tax=Oryza punctata TaxID=4537 RepID=A0A0E0KF76_ORYPU
MRSDQARLLPLIRSSQIDEHA